MQYISPYSIRVREKGNKTPLILQQINVLGLLDNFIHETQCNNINRTDDLKRAYIFEDVTWDKINGNLYGWFKTGHYGVESDIHDINTGDIDYKKGTNKSDLSKHYFQFHLNLNSSDEGICMIHSYGINGIKTFLSRVINDYLDTLQPPYVFELSPLAYEKALQEWTNENVKELRVTKFEKVKDIADIMVQHGHTENFDTEIRVKGFFGKLGDHLLPNTNESKLAEVLGSFGTQIRAVVECNGKNRIFRIGPDAENQICQIELDEEKIDITNGVPNLSSIHKYVNEIVSEYSSSMYQNVI